MNASFFEDFYNQADLPYGPSYKADFILFIACSIINFSLHIPIIYAILGSNSRDFRKGDKLFMVSMIIGNVIIAIPVVMVAFDGLIHDKWTTGYNGCLFSYSCICFGGTSTIVFSNLMVVEQGWYIIVRGRPWSNLFTYFLFVSGLIIAAFFVTAPFFSVKLSNYPTIRPARTYCVSDSHESITHIVIHALIGTSIWISLQNSTTISQIQGLSQELEEFWQQLSSCLSHQQQY